MLTGRMQSVGERSQECLKDFFAIKRMRIGTPLKPVRLQPVLHTKRSHHSEKHAHLSEEQPLLAATRESLCTATKT